MAAEDRIVIVGGARTPTGVFGGSLAGIPNHELGAHAVKAATARAGVDVTDVDEFIIDTPIGEPSARLTSLQLLAEESLTPA